MRVVEWKSWCATICGCVGSPDLKSSLPSCHSYPPTTCYLTYLTLYTTMPAFCILLVEAQGNIGGNDRFVLPIGPAA